MAVQKVDYEDKIGLQNDPNTPNKNKVTDEDMNQLKSKINNNADELNEAQENIENLQQGQGTVSGDIASLKNRVSTLELDNTRNKQDIANKVDKVDGKGLSTEDFTTGLKAKLEGLSNYNDTEIKEDIQDIKSEQTTQNTKLQELEDNQIHITTERASNLNVQDASGQNAKINIFGISKQEGTPSPENSVEIENTTGNVKITSCNKNLFNIDEFKDFFNLTETGTDAGHNYVAYTTKTYENNKFMQGKFKANTQYTISFLGRQKQTGQGQISGFVFNYTDGTNSIKYVNNDEVWTEYTLTSDKNKTIDYISMGWAYGGTIWLSDIQLEENSIKTDYIENEQQTTTFPLSQNQKMFEGSYLANDGIHHKRKQIELDGTETVIDSGYNETTHHFTIRPTDKAFGQMGILSNMFVNSTEATKVYSVVGNNSNTNITFKMPLEYATVDSFKTFLAQQKQAGTPVIVEYPLSEEEVEAYTEEQQTAYDQLQNAKTYKTVTNVFTDNAEVEMNYIADTKTYIDNKYNSLAQQILEIVGGN